MTRHRHLPRALILAAAGVWIGLALEAPARAADTPVIALKGKFTAASRKEELLKACREQIKPETPVPLMTARAPAAIDLPGGLSNYTLCQALAAGSEATCASAKQDKEGCVEGYRMHQILLQNDAAGAASACLRLAGIQNAIEPGRQAEACKIIAEMPQDGDIDASCEKVQALFKDGKHKKKNIRECARTWMFLDGESSCDSIPTKDRAVECVNYARLRAAVKAQDAKECGDSATCLAAMTHSAEPCAAFLPPAKAPADTVKSQREQEDACEARVADQMRKEMSDEAAFRKSTGRYDYKDGDPLLHLMPASELPPVPTDAKPPGPTPPPADPPSKKVSVPVPSGPDGR